MSDDNFLYKLNNGVGNSSSGGQYSPADQTQPLTEEDVNGIVSANLRTQTERQVMVNGSNQSQNFVTGVSGWQIDAEGNAEFNNGVFRGDVVLGGVIRTVSHPADIQPAINVVALAGGGSIYIAPGTYNMTSNIDLPSNVYLIGASRSSVIIDFGNGAYSVRSIGTVGTHTINVLVKDFTIQNSSASGLKMQYNDVSQINGIDVYGCLIGIELDNVIATGIVGEGINNTGNGTNVKITNSFATSIYFSTMDSSTSGNGLEISDSSGMTIFDSSISSNILNGISLTNCSNIAFMSLTVSNNGAKGLELVSGNSDLQFDDMVVKNNVSDGLKLTATNTRIVVSNITFLNNGGYGVNIAASSNLNNIINSSNFNGNTSGAVNNLGMTSIIKGNQGTVDYPGILDLAVYTVATLPTPLGTQGFLVPSAFE